MADCWAARTVVTMAASRTRQMAERTMMAPKTVSKMADRWAEQMDEMTVDLMVVTRVGLRAKLMALRRAGLMAVSWVLQMGVS